MHLTKHSINRSEFVLTISDVRKRKLLEQNCALTQYNKYITVSLKETFANLKYLINAHLLLPLGFFSF